jgi:hypothetical protein
MRSNGTGIVDSACVALAPRVRLIFQPEELRDILHRPATAGRQVAGMRRRIAWMAIRGAFRNIGQRAASGDC